MTTKKTLTDSEIELMRPLARLLENLYFSQLVEPTISNAVASTLCTGAIRSTVLAVMMSERHSGPDHALRAEQLDFLIAQFSETYNAEILRIERDLPSFHRAIDAALSLKDLRS